MTARSLISILLIPFLGACSLMDVPVEPVQSTAERELDFLKQQKESRAQWILQCESTNAGLSNLGVPAMNCQQDSCKVFPLICSKEDKDRRDAEASAFIPKARADDSVALSPLAPTFVEEQPIQSAPVVDRKATLREYLSNKGSPYADVDIIGSCERAGLDSHQCRLLLAICFAESDHGTNYSKVSGGRVVSADEEGLGFHNCGGVKRGSWNKQYPYVGGGWYLVQFPDWQTYWDTTTAGMKTAWFDKGGDRADILCYKYVGNAGTCEQSWVGRVQQAERELSWMLV